MSSSETTSSASSATSTSTYTSDDSSSASITSTAASSETNGYWSTAQILARHAASTPISAPPNASIAFEPKRGFTPYISLGPVIGMVTDTTARILAEASQTTYVKCFLTDRLGVQHGVIEKCVRDTPTIFHFEELRSDTYYRITFDLPCPGLIKSGFKTLMSHWTISKSPARIAVVSTNHFPSTRDKVQTDLWKSLYSQCKRGQIDYIFHLGNIVFVDSNEYNDRNELQGETYCAYQEAFNYCADLSPNHLIDAEKRVMDLFRNVYRDAWNVPTTRHCLANSPNLMILNDHEIAHRLGDRENTNLTIHSFLQFCAYKVYNEYCTSLFGDFPHPRTGDMTVRSGQAYHFHAFGDLGFLFLDTRAQRTLHTDYAQSDQSNSTNMNYLMTKQWADLEYALSEDGYLHDCRVLLVCTSSPICQVGEPGLFTSQKKIAGTWNSTDALAEGSLLIERLFTWKSRKPGRSEIVLLSGSSTDAGMTEILDLRLHAANNIRCERMRQIVSGPIAYLGSSGKGEPRLGANKNSTKWIGPNHQFRHFDVINANNYALVDIERGESGYVVRCQHVLADKKGVVAKEQVASTERMGRFWASKPSV